MTYNIVSFDDSALRDLSGDNIGVEVVTPCDDSVQSSSSAGSYLIGLNDRWQKVALSSKKSVARRSCHIDVSGDEVVEIALGVFEDEEETEDPDVPSVKQSSSSKASEERKRSIVRTLVTSLSPTNSEMEDIALTPPAPAAEAPLTMEENQDVSRKSAWRTFSWKIATTASHSTQSISWDDNATFDDDDHHHYKENDKNAGNNRWSRWRNNRKNKKDEIDPSQVNLSPLANKDEENVLASNSKSFSPIPKLSKTGQSLSFRGLQRSKSEKFRSKKTTPSKSLAAL